VNSLIALNEIVYLQVTELPDTYVDGLITGVVDNTGTELKTTKPKMQKTLRKKSHSWFEWVHLIATISVPIAIAIYTVVQNSSEARIATKNIRKDREIAQASRAKDLDIALDQQRENTLVEYTNFLAKLLSEGGMMLNKSVTDKDIAWFKTLTAMKRLDGERKSFLLETLFYVGLVTKSEDDNPFNTGVLRFVKVDLSGVTLGTPRDSPVAYPEEHFVQLSHLSLPYANLTNASFRHTRLDHANFLAAIMNFTDFTQARTFYSVSSCDMNRLIFRKATLRGAIFFAADFYRADFSSAELTYANLTFFRCSLCDFSHARLDHVYISQSYFIKHINCTAHYNLFSHAILNESFLSAVTFIKANFDSSILTRVHGTHVVFNESTFSDAFIGNSSFQYSIIFDSHFINADLSYCDLSGSQMKNVSFMYAKLHGAIMSHITCEYCVFRNTDLTECVLKNATLTNCDFRHSNVTDQQLLQARELTGSILRNGTII
jgi:uncharacterized protein YjbI with pentapeptide repeats